MTVMLTDQLAYTVAAMTDPALPFVLVDACGVPVAVVDPSRQNAVHPRTGKPCSRR
jgi:hypothetical protein